MHFEWLLNTGLTVLLKFIQIPLDVSAQIVNVVPVNLSTGGITICHQFGLIATIMCNQAFKLIRIKCQITNFNRISPNFNRYCTIILTARDFFFF